MVLMPPSCVHSHRGHGSMSEHKAPSTKAVRHRHPGIVRAQAAGCFVQICKQPEAPAPPPMPRPLPPPKECSSVLGAVQTPLPTWGSQSNGQEVRRWALSAHCSPKALPVSKFWYHRGGPPCRVSPFQLFCSCCLSCKEACC